MPSLFQPGQRTLRVRLTAWYVLVVGLTLLLFSIYLYFQVEGSLLAQLDAALQVAASQALVDLNDEVYPPTFLKTERFQDMTRRLSQSGFAVRLIASDGTVSDGFGDYRAIPPWLPAAPGYATVEGDEEDSWRIYSQPIHAAGGHPTTWLQATQSVALVHQAAESLRTQIFLGLPLVLLLAGLGGFFLADRALRPIGQITRTARAISASDLNQRINYRGPADELGQLATTFDQMLERLQGAFVRERRFTADASHELRTPLTALKGHFWATLSQPRTASEYENTLRDLEKEVDRLIRLATDLLFLARLDQSLRQWQSTPVDLSDLLDATVEQVRPLAEAKGLALSQEAPPGLTIQGDLDHLIRLFLNLLDNAIKYTPAGGRVTVRTWAEATSVRVAVSDTGVGVPPEHLPLLFERFYRVEAARSRDQGGAGLGLAIAYEIARWHGGMLEIQSEPGQGTTVTVQLPVQAPGEQRTGVGQDLPLPISSTK